MKDNYFIVYPWVFELFKDNHNRTDYIKALTLLAVYSFTKNGVNEWYGSQTTLAKMVGTTRQSLNAKLNELVDEGYIIKSEEANGSGTFSFWVNLEKMEGVVSDYTPVVTDYTPVMSDDTPLSSVTTPPVMSDDIINNNINKTNTEDNSEVDKECTETYPAGPVLGVTEEISNKEEGVSSHITPPVKPTFDEMLAFMGQFSYPASIIKSIYQKGEDQHWLDKGEPITKKSNGWKAWAVYEANKLQKAMAF